MQYFLMRWAVIWKSTTTLKRICHHFDEIFITGCTGICEKHFDEIFVTVKMAEKWKKLVQFCSRHYASRGAVTNMV